MQRLLCLGICACLCHIGLAQSAEIHLRGRYNGENLFLQNPLYQDHTTFCIDEIRVNNHTLVREPKTSALEVKLDHIPLHAAVDIYIKHKPHCSPKVLNPEALATAGQATFLYFYAKDLKLFWKVRGQEADTQYVVEYLNGDQWEEEVTLKASPDSATYVYTPTTFIQGVNKFRVRYVSSTFLLHSTDVEILLQKTTITFSPQVVRDRITLSTHTYFEILDANQQLILQGEAREIPLRKLKPGDYFIVLEDEMYPFVKR